jgi:hypothetical protein
VTRDLSLQDINGISQQEFKTHEKAKILSICIYSNSFVFADLLLCLNFTHFVRQSINHQHDRYKMSFRKENNAQIMKHILTVLVLQL